MTRATPSARLSRAIGVDLLLIAVLLLSCCYALTIGPAHLSLTDVARALVAPLLHRHAATIADEIVWPIRAPRIVLAAALGASLSAAGTAFQSLLRNDLAEPYTTGVSAGASVAGSATLAFGWDTLLGGAMLPLAAFGGALAVIVLTYGGSKRGGRIDTRAMLLLGVVASAFLWAVQTLVLTLAGKSADTVLRWSFGSLANADWPTVALMVVPAAVGLALLASQSYTMNLFSLGETEAMRLGVSVERFKATIIFAGSLLTAASVAASGIIAFVGLVVPHIARRLTGTPDHRIVLPAAALAGALALVWSDTLARVLLGGDRIPVGVVTAFWGGPFFFWLLRRDQLRGTVS